MRRIADQEKRSSVGFGELEVLVRERAQAMIQDLLEEEVTSFLGRGWYERGSSLGKRNGYGRPRRLSIMSGTIEVRRPRVRGVDFESKVLPLFRRRSNEVSSMLPELYLHGLSSGDFEMALRGLLGEGAPLSAGSIQRLKAKWQLEYEEWRRRDLSSFKLVYQWADGIYVKAGLEKEKSALLVIIGTDTSGQKHLIACEGGYRESKESWMAVLRELKKRGLRLGALTVADGHLGIWAALQEMHPEGSEQRCWNHKILNVLDRLPKKAQGEARELLKAMPYAGTQKECEKLKNSFILRYRKNYSKACEILENDWERMVSFYSFPKEHWVHLRTTNIVESPFAVVRLRTAATKRFKKIDNATAMIWKVLQVAQKSWRRLKGYETLNDVYEGRRFVDGLQISELKIKERLAA